LRGREGGRRARTPGGRRWRCGGSCRSCSRTRNSAGPSPWSDRRLPPPPPGPCGPCRLRRLPRRRPRGRRRHRGSKGRCRRTAPCSSAAAAGPCWGTRCTCARRRTGGSASSSASVSAGLAGPRGEGSGRGSLSGGPRGPGLSGSLFLLRSHERRRLGGFADGRPGGSPAGLVRSSPGPGSGRRVSGAGKAGCGRAGDRQPGPGGSCGLGKLPGAFCPRASALRAEKPLAGTWLSLWSKSQIWLP